MKKQLVASALLSLVLAASIAQSPSPLEALRLDLFTLPNGKGGNHVQAMAQDHYGFLWFGSQYGLHRWDGHKFKTYTHSTWDGASISSNYIECLYVAKDGTLWIGTWGEGLNHFSHETDKFKRYRYDGPNTNSIPSDFVSVITEDHQGNIWIGTQAGLCKLDRQTDRFSHFQHKKNDKSSLDCNQVRALTVDQSGTLWVGTGFPFFERKEGGLNKFLPGTGTFQRFSHSKGNPDGLAGYHVRAIFEDSQRRLWVGSSGGMQVLDRATGKFAKPSFNLPPDWEKSKHFPHITFLLEDNRKRFWAGHFDGGIFSKNPATGEQVVFNAASATPVERRLLENAAWSLFQSKDGVIWLSTASDQGRVYRIVESSAPGGYLDPLPSTKTLMEKPGNSIIDRLKDSAQYAPKKEKPALLPTANSEGKIIPSEQVPGRQQEQNGFDKHNMVWSVSGKNQEIVKMTDGHNGTSAIFLIAPPAKPMGDWKSDPKTDEQGNFWVCLENGLLKLNTGEKKGFFIDAKKLGGTPPFKGMVMDNLGVFWILGQTLLKFEPLLERAFSFGKGDGLANLPANADQILLGDDGEIVIKGNEGVFQFKPSDWQGSSNAPVLRITDFELLDLADMAAFDSSQQASFWETCQLVLEHYQNAFFFRFAVMDFQSPEQHQLEYMLENHDKNWRQAEGDPRAIYANVPPGSYRFRVRGANEYGVWGDEATLLVVIKTPWWRTWWAYSLYGLMALFFLFRAYRFQLNRRLAESETIRLKELHDTKSRLYTNITHEFRTPLTIIMGMARQVKDNPKAHLENGLNLILRNGEQLLGLVNQLLDLSKLEGGKMEFKPTMGDVVHFLKTQIDGIKPIAAEKGIGLHLLSDMERLDMEHDPEKLQQVMANILSNAIKFTPKGGHIYVNLAVKDIAPSSPRPCLAIKIRDTGQGIPADALPHIFDRFYQVDSSSTRQGGGSGIGLSITKEFAELMGGEIKVKSWEGAGTEFTILLPMKKKGLLSLAESSVPTKKDWSAAPVVLQLPEANTSTPSQPLMPLPADNGLPTLLLIEDNPDVVAYLATCLQNQYNLLVGSDGQEGLDIAFERIPDIIITDVMMPLKDGFEVSHSLKNDHRTSHIPIIMLTAKADMGSKLEGLEKGADAYLSKPFNQEELLIRLRKLLELRKRLQQYYQSLAGIGTSMPLETAESQEAGTAATKQEDYFVLKARRTVEAHLDDFDFNVETLCRDMGMSHSQFHRKLSALTGLSATFFIRNVRLSRAKDLLREQPPRSITAVAMDCGFSDPGYFGRVFKKEFGLTPLEWQGNVLPS